MILVTGFAHSGTTFLAQVLQEMGYHFSTPLDHMEDFRLRRLLFEVNNALSRHGTVERLAQRFGDKLRKTFAGWEDLGLGHPHQLVVKQPSAIHCLSVLLEAGIRPSWIILCRRDLKALLASLRAYGQYEMGRSSGLKIPWIEGEIERFIFTAETARILVSDVWFPVSVEARNHIPDALRVSTERDRWYAAWEKVRRPEYVHYGG